jgi:hypothetical protein
MFYKVYKLKKEIAIYDKADEVIFRGFCFLGEEFYYIDVDVLTITA